MAGSDWGKPHAFTVGVDGCCSRTPVTFTGWVAISHTLPYPYRGEVLRVRAPGQVVIRIRPSRAGDDAAGAHGTSLARDIGLWKLASARIHGSRIVPCSAGIGSHE